MPVGFLTQADKDRFNRFPETIPHEDLVAFFLLTKPDLALVQQCREEHTRLGFALQLCALRFLGFVPDELRSTPTVVVEFVAEQLQVSSGSLFPYGQRPATRTAHFQQILRYLGFRKPTADDLQQLSQWLLARALEHDRPTLLLQLACDYMLREKWVRPGISRLEQWVSRARNQAQEETHRVLMPLLPPSRQVWLDALLETDADKHRTSLVWLRTTATAANAQQILTTLEKIEFLQQNGVANWDVSAVNPNRLKKLAQIGCKSTNQYLQRSSKKRRYPILVAFLKQTLITLIDEVVEMFDECLWDSYTNAKKDLEAYQKRVAKSVNEKLRRFCELGEVLLDETVTDEAVRSAVFKQVPATSLRLLLDETAQLVRPGNDDYVDYFANHYSYLRRFIPRFLKQLRFRANPAGQSALKAIDLLRQLDANKPRQPIPPEAPLDFVPSAWRAYVIDEEGKITRRYYELCALWVLRQGLRCGDIWVENSRRYADPETYLIPRKRWPEKRQEVCKLTRTPADGAQRIAEREGELEQLLEAVDRQLSNPDSALRLEKNQLVLTPFEAEGRPESADLLAGMITERMPRIDITDLLTEVDTWVHFSDHFKHATGNDVRGPDFLLHLYACLLAQAGNFGFSQMAQNTGIAHHRLLWCNTWYIREATLRGAYSSMVDFHHALPLSKSWGSGMLSSSDGQRFPVSGKARVAKPLQRYYAHREGVTFYTWSSDQLSQYGTKVASTTIRDSTYVLDELLDNETELSILEHTTDTAGFTDLIFALFDLLDIRFSPRIRDMSSLQLYRTDAIDLTQFARIRDQVGGFVDRQHVIDGWDDILRVAGSLKLGWVTASLFVQKLQSYPQQNELTRTLQEYGRLVRTLHILRWYNDEDQRRRIQRQLNKGEALHSLRAAISVANRGILRQKDEEGLTQQAGCLNLVTNAVVIWNTVYMAAVIEQLKKEGYPVRDSDVGYIWPTRHRHVNFHGQFRFDVEGARQRKGLRELRKPSRW
jgi:TnpA family transposase